MKNFAEINRASTGAKKNFKLFEKLWEHGRTLRRVGMVLVMCLITITQVWAWYLPGTINGSERWSISDNNMGADNQITFYAVQPGTYKCKLSDGSSFKNGSWTDGSGGDGLEIYYDNGDIKLVLTQERDVYVKYDGNDKVWIQSFDPSYHIKYNWAGTGWAWSKAMTNNGDGTYSCVGRYNSDLISASTGYRYRMYSSDDDSDSGSQWHSGFDSGSVTGDPTGGDYCIYTFKPSDNTLKIHKCNSIAATSHIYFDNTATDWSTTNKYLVIGRPTYMDATSPYMGVYDMSVVDHTKLWYYEYSSSTFADADYYAVAGHTSAVSTDNVGAYAVSNGTFSKYTGLYASCYNMSNTVNYIIIPSSGSNGASIDIRDWNTYASAMNSTQTIKYSVSFDGSSTYSELTSGGRKTPAQISISAYKFNDGTYSSVSNTSNSQSISANQNSTVSTSVPAAYTGETTLSYTSMSTHFTFIGWYNAASGGSEVSNPYYPTTGQAVYARFQAKKYTVTYNANGGSCGTSSAQATAFTSVTLPTPSRDGCTFEGWYDASGTKIGNSGASYTPTADITLYAHFTDNIDGKLFSYIDGHYGAKCKAFDLSGWASSDQGGSIDKTYTNGTTGIELSIDNGGWDGKSATASIVAPMIKFFGTSTTKMSVTIPTGKHATITILYGSYTKKDKYLKLDGSDLTKPSGDMKDNVTNTDNFATVTLTDKTGIVNDFTTNSGNVYIAKVSATITGYTVTYDKGTYGSGSIAADTKPHGTNFTLSNSTFSRDGYTQDGWSTEDGGAKAYNLGGTYSTDAAITLYPHWAATSYTLSYDLDGGNVASDNPTSYTIESSAITLNNPTKTGYTFAGWTGTGLDAATTTVTIAAGSTGNRSYTATWTAIVPSSVSLNKSSTTITEGETETLTATISPAVVADNTITWISSDEDVATVDDGVVTAVAAGTATITATTVNDKTATCEVTVEAEAVSSSINLEQGVLDHGKSWGYASALTSANITTSGSAFSLDSLNDGISDGKYKKFRNYPYLGLKIKNSGSYVSVNLPKDKALNVKFGYIKDSVKVFIDDTEIKPSPIKSNTSKESKTYTLSSSGSNRTVKFQTPNGEAVVIKQIMIGESLESITLPAKITLGATTNGTISVEDTKVNVGSTVAITVTPFSGYKLDELTVTRDTIGSPSVSVTDNEFTMPNNNVTINATFVAAAPACTDPGLVFASATKTTTLCDAAPTNALTNTYGVAVTYTSTDETVATVASDGTLTIKKAGTTTITASSVEQTVSAVTYCADNASYTLTVNASTAAGLSYASTSVSKDANASDFTNELTNSHGLTVTYESSDPSVATVNASTGEVDVKAAGTTTITASSVQQKVSSTCYLAGEATYTLTVNAVYTVTYEYNGADGGLRPASATASSVTLPSPSKTGFEFDGWYNTAGTKVSSPYAPTADITLYARWEKECEASGGGSTEVLSSVAVNSSYAVVASVGANVASSGLDGSNRTQIGSSSEYANKLGNSGYVRLYPKLGSAFAADDVLYYKVYNGKAKTKEMNVAVYQNDGTTYEPSAVSIESNATYVFEITLTSAMIDATNGYVQVMRGSEEGDGAWFVSARIESTSGGGGGTCYHVYYHGNGAESGFINDTTSYESSDKATVLAYNYGRYPLAKTNYTFSEWNTKDDGKGDSYSASDKITISANVHLYAVWAEAATTYTVTYANGGATGDVPVDASSPYEEDAPVTVLAKGSLAKTGYSFGGWSANVDLTIDAVDVTAGTPIAAGKKFAMPATNVTLTAVWNINSYDLTWDLAGGTTTSTGTGIASGVSVNTTASVEYETTLSAPSVEKTGYTFSAWSPSVAATMPAANTTYTATWTKDTYTITYELHDEDAGSVSGKTSYQITDDDYDLPTPEWDGHTFLGWYATYSDGDYSDPVSVLASGSTGDKTYHAKWADGVEIVWTITKVDSKLYKGGTGYSVKAVVNNTSWTGHDNLVLSASDGVTLGTPTKSTVDSKAQIVADFSISGSLADDAITFSLYAPATGVYAAIEDEKEVELDACPSGGGSTTVISIFKGTSDGDNTNTKDAVKYKQDKKWTDATTGLASTAKGVKDALYVFASNSWTTANSTVGGTAYTQGIQNGGSTASDYHFKIEIPTGYTAEIYLVAGRAGGSLNLGLNKSAIAPQSGTHADKVWYASYSSSKVLQAWTIEDVPAGTYYLVGNASDVIFAELKITLTGGSSAIATELSWSGDDASAATAGTVNKNDVDADFTLSATRSTNSIGAITYTSSNTSVATVDEAGKVHIINGGTTTITATLAACGCYGGDEISYSLVVANTCADTPGTIVNDDGSAIAGNAISRGACEALTLRLTGHSGSTIQWMKDGENVGTNSDTYVVPTGVSGVYTATVTGASCTLEATNSITVTTAGVPDPTIFADDFYVKSGKWFGYRLMQINRGETVTVKTAPDGWTENTDFSITTDASGIVSISGRKTISTPANKTLTLTIANECDGSVDKNITIREMAATAKPTVAWIATNNKGGSGQKDNVKADESTNTDLYDHLKDDYIITPRNCYWTTNEADLVKEYSQYDLIILTDYPNSQTGPNGSTSRSKSYTNAIGLLIDHKPILTFEAYVAGCPNWGIASDPKNTQETQTDMTLLCNADEIFGTSGKFAAGEAITVTSASSGQALQGFPVASSPDFVFIGKITDNDLKTYVACCERQHEIAARMMVFGLNSSIMSSLTDDGKTMVKGFIEYLLKDDPASVPDCSVIFNGGGETNSWYNTENWEAGLLPDQYASVRIDAPCVVPANEDPAKAGRIKIHVTDMNSGSLTIEPEGRMIVEKTITRIEGNAYTIHMPTEPVDLIIQSDETAQGALIFDNESGTTQATVEMYSKGRYYDGVYNWQYVAVPLVSASRWNMGDWAYCFDNSIGGWTGNDVCPAFSAVGVTRMDDELPTYEFYGPLASTKNQTLTLYTSAAGNDGYNMIGNSWTAPIQIVNFQPGDFGTALYQVNIYNTGHDPEGGPAAEESKDQQGRWKTIPIAATQAAIDAGTWKDLKVIPSMQAFEVQNATGANTTLTLNYDRLVRTLPTDPNLNETKRAPRRTPVERTAVPQMRITLKDETTCENLYLFSGEQFSEGFDNGWDGVYNAGEAGYMQIYMLSPIGNLEISAQPEMEGTTFGFTAGSREVYTFSFKYVGNEELYFNDLKEKKSTLINDENEYTFTAQEGENGIRFMISATPYNSQQITTGMTDLDAEAPQAQKVIYNDKLYIIRGGKVFSADGHLVK